MSNGDTRVLGVDTSLRCSGIAVVEGAGQRLRAVEHGCVRNPASLALSECLRRLHAGIMEVIARCRPEAVAIEGIFFCKNVRTAVTLGEARGVVIAAAAGAGIPVFEYAPRRVKQAVVGHGAAEKDQVRRMVMALLTLTEEPQEDAGDALAIAICHMHSRSAHAALAPQQI